ncbi:Surface antigen [Cyclonatronum proteinivorum]|uniref:Surface antigen n=1 Tax=Cyclonatronum proteinivorum TaxID=1457365 RepID=A0A345UHX8_9BACT|nr:BamA/TamA family outer membrane protein [Cyclonatronum proteinivorum]AXJ00080.1 Surface antigen [Cyclonatronum proteinivorum]
MKDLSRILHIVALTGIILLGTISDGRASNTDSVSVGGIPTAGFSSDSGFGFGGFLQHITYEQDHDHFRRKFRAQSTIFLRGKLFANIVYEHRFASDDHFLVSAAGQLDPDALYFGRGMEAEFSASDLRSEIYHYRREMFMVEAVYSFALGSSDRIRYFLDAGVSGGAIRTKVSDDSRLGQQQLFGISGGIRNAVFAGLRRDARDNINRTSEGSYFTGRLTLIPELTGNRNTLIKTEGSAAFYLPLAELGGEPLLLASRAQFRQIIGKAPFYEQPTLGDEFTLRGYPLERFRDNGSMLLTAEFRGWLFRLPWYNAQLGGHVFTDAGTVFLHPGQMPDLRQWRMTGGIGGVLSVFTRDFVLRGDLGFSREAWRIYAGLGYTF